MNVPQQAAEKWWHSAACREYGPGLFEPSPGRTGLDHAQIAAARAICDTCPLWVREACLEDALTLDDRTTFRAGTTPEQRKVIARKRKRTDRGRGGHKLSPCGTYGAYKRHVREGEEPCQPCADAYRTYNRRRRTA